VRDRLYRLVQQVYARRHGLLLLWSPLLVVDPGTRPSRLVVKGRQGFFPRVALEICHVHRDGVDSGGGLEAGVGEVRALGLIYEVVVGRTLHQVRADLFWAGDVSPGWAIRGAMAGG